MTSPNKNHDSQNRILKQNFQKEQIIDQDYSGADFSEFLEGKKEGGTNVDNWTYQELIYLIDEFKNIYVDDDEYSDSEQIDLPSKNDVNIKLNDEDISKINAMKNETELGSTSNVKCKIIKTENLKTGWFKKSNFYHIETRGMKTIWKVKRSHEEFLWLREKLVETFPGAFIPPVECSESATQFLQNFLLCLLERRELRNCNVVEHFLKVEDLQTMYGNLDQIDNKNFFGNWFSSNSYNNLTLHAYKQMAEKCVLNDNYAKMSFEDLLKHCNDLDKVCDQNTPQYELMKKLGVTLTNSLTQASDVLFEMGTLIGKINKNQENAFFSDNETKNKGMTNPYELLQKGINGWGTHLIQVNKYVTDHVIDYFAYAKAELLAQKELGNLRKYSTEVFLKDQKILYRQKKMAFESKEQNNWYLDINMLNAELSDPVVRQKTFANWGTAERFIMPKETQEIDNKRQLTEFASYQQIAEYQLFRKRNNRRLVNNFGGFSLRMKRNVVDNKEVLWNILDDIIKNKIFTSGIYLNQSKFMDQSMFQSSIGGGMPTNYAGGMSHMGNVGLLHPNMFESQVSGFSPQKDSPKKDQGNGGGQFEDKMWKQYQNVFESSVQGK